MQAVDVTGSDAGRPNRGASKPRRASPRPDRMGLAELSELPVSGLTLPTQVGGVRRLLTDPNQPNLANWPM